jgi:hypothetical protein
VALPPPAPAAAATPCWKRLINDWYDGRIDQAYPVQCYRQAIKNLPEDVKAYSSAREDIRRALLAAFRSNRGKPLGPNSIVRPPGDRRSSAGARRVGAREADDERSAGGATSRDDDDSGGPLGAFFEALAPGKADSIPLPLIVLAALAMLLLAAAAAGLVTRRLQARGAPDAPPSEIDPPPPFWPQNPPLRR